MSGVENDPEFQAWAAELQEGLVPKMQDSEVILQLVPKGPTDIKFAVELGLSIMLDKPIIALVYAGTEVPSKLLKVADKVIFYTSLDDVQTELYEAIKEIG